ncbi:hypothetical protein BTR23_08090 [Alkalihalophilus pseudofirmus]|nr:hypothetical protein BTR23_08090 [Alkalihalophilus pseudofirmus]
MFKVVLTNLQKMFVDHYSSMVAPYHLLFNEQFMERYTSFYSWQQFIRNSYLDAENIQAMIESNKEEWEQFIVRTTRFSSWREMLDKAEEQYLLERPPGPYQYM